MSRTTLRTLICLGFAVALIAGCGAPQVAPMSPGASIAMTANPSSINPGETSTLTVTSSNATGLTISGSDGSSYALQPSGGTQTVSPKSTTTYQATAVRSGGTATATATVTVSAVATPAVGITANPTSITVGGSSLLTVTATNATQVVIKGSDNSSYTLPGTGGTQAVNPSSTTTYTATATGAGGTASATATVTVAPNSAPTVGITANPTSITAGGSSLLTVTATNATQVVIKGSDNSSYTLPGTGGAQAVNPSSTTTYTATATGAGGTASASATVTVVANPVPTVGITANPSSIAAGGSSLLTVTATNATQVVIKDSDNSSYTLPGTGGTQAVNPSSTTTYAATATGAGGTASASATITVVANPVPTVGITANPTSIAAGGSSLLTVTATNATQVVIKGSDNSSYTLPGTGGTQAVNPSSTATYAATAAGAGGTASATVTVTVTPNPAPTVTVVADPASISAGATSTLQVTAAHATQVTITGSDGSSYTLLSPNGGTQAVTPSTTTNYAVTATGPGGTASAATTITVKTVPAPAVSITANPTTIVVGNSSTLTVTASNATQVTIAGSDGSTYNLTATGGTQPVHPATNTSYTATATGAGGTATASVTVVVTTIASLQSIDHVIFMMQENRSFDSYFGMLNPYRQANNWTVASDGTPSTVDGIDDKLNKISNRSDEGTAYRLFKSKSTCLDDMSSAWLESFGDVNRYNFSTSRGINMDGFVHIAEGFANSCVASGACSGTFTDTTGRRAMGYYDQGFLNYYYYMASQFALSDRWFSPVASKSIPNRIATFTGGTTQGLVYDPGSDDHLPQLNIPTIFQELDNAHVSWKVYYTVTQNLCLVSNPCSTSPSGNFPATTFSMLSYSFQYLYTNTSHAACTGTTKPSSTVGDPTNSFCIDTNHIAPLSAFFTDLKNGTLPSFAFIESGSGINDEHPGSGQSILTGQLQVASILNAFMAGSSWKDSVFFLAYDEGGGPYDHVPPVPGHSNAFTNASLGTIPDISTIAVNPDNYKPCVPEGGIPTVHCDLREADPGANPTDAPAVKGFAAQIGFRVPNMIVSPFVKAHYVSHVPMDHLAIIKFVETRFIGSSARLTARDAAQPNLLDFFDFTNIPWATPPTPPVPATPSTLGYDPCTPASMGP